MSTFTFGMIWCKYFCTFHLKSKPCLPFIRYKNDQTCNKQAVPLCSDQHGGDQNNVNHEYNEQLFGYVLGNRNRSAAGYVILDLMLWSSSPKHLTVRYLCSAAKKHANILTHNYTYFHVSLLSGWWCSTSTAVLNSPLRERSEKLTALLKCPLRPDSHTNICTQLDKYTQHNVVVIVIMIIIPPKKQYHNILTSMHLFLWCCSNKIKEVSRRIITCALRWIKWILNLSVCVWR